ASQATEPSVLVALTRGASFAVLAGDPRQLPPTVMSAEALAAGLDVTLFERVVASGISPMLLDTQYRMHPAISAFPSAFFYGGRLKDGVVAADKPAPL
ncbi:Regulator of nonsense transcripts 1, partial [Tetrabaena socialis]